MQKIDLIEMAESGLRKFIVGEWEIKHDMDNDVWGRAVVTANKLGKSGMTGVILTNKVQHCTFQFRPRPKAGVKEIYNSPVSIEWGDGQFATMESTEPDCIRWRLPPDEGKPGELTVWRRMNSSEPSQRAAATEDTADVWRRAAEDVEDEHAKAADRLAEARTQSLAQVAAVRSKAATEIAEIRSKAALQEKQATARAVLATSEAEKARARAAELEELAEARAGVADEIAAEGRELRRLLESEVANREVMEEQVRSLRTLVVELMAKRQPEKRHQLEDLLNEKPEKAWPLSPMPDNQENTTPNKELHPKKKRRTNKTLAMSPKTWSMAAAGGA